MGVITLGIISLITDSSHAAIIGPVEWTDNGHFYELVLPDDPSGNFT
jgi:hypothetical protein